MNSISLTPSQQNFKNTVKEVIHLTKDEILLIDEIYQKYAPQMVAGDNILRVASSNNLPVSIHLIYDNFSETVRVIVSANSTEKYANSLSGRGTYKKVIKGYAYPSGDKFAVKISHLFNTIGEEHVTAELVESDYSFAALSNEIDWQRIFHNDNAIFNGYYKGKASRHNTMNEPADRSLKQTSVVKFVSFEKFFNETMSQFYKDMVFQVTYGQFEDVDFFKTFQAIVQSKFISILKSVKVLIDNGYAHTDIKPDNIDWSNGRVIDFGLMKSLKSSSFPIGTYAYQAPVLNCLDQITFKDKAIKEAPSELQDAKCDIFSIGASFYLIINGYDYYPNSNSIMFVKDHSAKLCGYKVLPLSDNRKKPDLWPKFDQKFENLILRMLDTKANNRPAIEEALDIAINF